MSFCAMAKNGSFGFAKGGLPEESGTVRAVGAKPNPGGSGQVVLPKDFEIRLAKITRLCVLFLAVFMNHFASLN